MYKGMRSIGSGKTQAGIYFEPTLQNRKKSSKQGHKIITGAIVVTTVPRFADWALKIQRFKTGLKKKVRLYVNLKFNQNLPMNMY